MSNIHDIEAHALDYINPKDAQDGTRAASPSEDDSTIKPSDKKLTEELAAMLPKSWIDPMFATQLWQNLDINLGLSGILTPDRTSDFSMQQSSIVMAMLAGWTKGLDIQTDFKKIVQRHKRTSDLKNFWFMVGKDNDSNITTPLLRGVK